MHGVSGGASVEKSLSYQYIHLRYHAAMNFRQEQ